jgi:hypothetical protein
MGQAAGLSALAWTRFVSRDEIEEERVYAV